MPVSKVCLLSQEEESAFVYDHIRPNCRNHRHVSKREAFEWTSSKHGYFRPVTSTVAVMGTVEKQQRTEFKQSPAAHFVIQSAGRYMVIRRLMAPEPRRSGGMLVIQWTGTPLMGGPRTRQSNGWQERMVLG